jgi:hypothetical protein
MTSEDIRPNQNADAIRAHWSIENRLHWIRDVVFAEDHSQIRTGVGPAVIATLRKLATSNHRLDGAINIAAACRDLSRHPNRGSTPGHITARSTLPRPWGDPQGLGKVGSAACRRGDTPMMR